MNRGHQRGHARLQDFRGVFEYAFGIVDDVVGHDVVHGRDLLDHFETVGKRHEFILLEQTDHRVTKLVDAFVQMKEGHLVRIRSTQKKVDAGWRVQSDPTLPCERMPCESYAAMFAAVDLAFSLLRTRMVRCAA